MKKIIIIALCAIMMCSTACTTNNKQNAEEKNTFEAEITQTPIQSLEPTQKPTPTPTPIKTPEPTPSPTPSPTPEPTSTAIQTQEPKDSTEPRKFDHDGETKEVIYDDGDIKVEMITHHEKYLTYFVADIHVSDVKYLKTAFSHGEYGGRGEKTDVQARNNNAIVAISGDYYDFRDKGLVIRNGKVYRTKLSELDVCVLYSDGTMKTYSPKECEERLDEILANDPWQSWCFGPKLLDNGEPMTEFNSKVNKRNPRCVIGYYAPGHYCLVTVDGRQGSYSRGLEIPDLAQLMHDLGCKEAFNLDGGQTSMMAVNGETYNQPFEGGRSVSDIIYVGKN